jgi:assimilatory nitrate reductase catalytic subunit
MTVRTTCPYCGVGCGIAVIDGMPLGDPSHPANFGRLCSKGAALKDTLALSDRLTKPILHGQEASWDQALDFIAAEFTRIREANGPDSIAFYVSGQFLTEDYYVANKLMKGFIGSGNIDTNSRLCMAASVAGHVRTFGEDVVPGCYEDLEEADLVVQVGSDTTALAHVVLPAASWGEKNGTVTNSERCISRQRAFTAPPGDARPDWWMFAEVARHMGFQTDFSYSGPADIFREHAALSAFENDGQRVFDIGALADLDDAAYEALRPTQWPCPRPGRGRSRPRLFARGGFPTPDGRARMLPLAVKAAEKLDNYPLILNTGRVRDQWHTMTRTGRVPRLMTHAAGPRLTLHPRDAVRRGIEDGGLARIESLHGSAVLRASIDDTVRAGNVFVPMHWTDEFSSSGPVGQLVHAATDEVSGQPDLKGTKVQVTALTETWRGLLLRRGDGNPALGETVHWSKAPIASGFSFEMAGWTPLSALIDSERVLRSLLQVSQEAELISYSDPNRAVFRYAGLISGRLEACVFFAAPRAAFPEAEKASRLLGQPLEPKNRLSLLASLEPGVAPAGKMICACVSVEEGAICTAIRAKKLTTVAEIGAALGAGTNCGSCIPELKKLLAAEGAQLPTVA